MSIVSIAAMGILAFISLIVVVNVIKATIRGLKKTVGTLIAIVLSAVIAAILTVVLCKPDSAMMMAVKPYLFDMLAGMGEIFALEAMQDALIYYAIMLVAPFFFMISYVLISIIVSIIIAIVIRFVPPHKKPRKLVDKLGGAGVGLVCGFLVAVILLSPIVGTVSTLLSAADELVAEDSDDEISLLIKEASENTALKAYNNMGCGLLYNAFASVDVNGERVYLKDDIAVIMSIVGTVSSLTGSSDGFGDEQISALNSMIADLDRSALLRNVVAEVFSSAAEKWSQGEAFMGMQMISAGEMIDPMLNEIVAVVATTDQTSVTADLRTLAEVLGVLTDSGLLSGSVNSEDMLKSLSEGQATSRLIIAINKNVRMAHIADQITKISVRALAATIGIPANAEERYELLMDDIALALNESEGMDEAERLDKLTADLTKAFDTYGVSVTDEAVAAVAESLVVDLGSSMDACADDVEEFFIVYHVASAMADSASVSGASVQFLSSNNSFTVSGGTLYFGERELRNYYAQNIEASSAYTLGYAHVDICDASSLYSYEKMISTRVTIDDIYEFLGKYSECDDIEAEAAKMDEIVSEVMSIFGDYDFDNVDSAVVMKDMGGLLDKMSGSRIFGQEAVNNLLKGILQSEKICSTLNLTTSEVTDFADDMNSIAAKEDQSYASVTLTVSQTINMIQDANSEKTREEKKENTAQLLNNLTEDTSKMLNKVVTSSLLSNHGVEENKSESVSGMVGSMLNNMATYSGENKESEADSVNMIIDFAVSEKHNDAEVMFNDAETEGSLGVTAEEFVALVVDSEVVSNTVKETVSKEDYAENPIVTKSLSEKEEASVISAMDKHYAESNNDAETAETLNALAVFINIEYSAE